MLPSCILNENQVIGEPELHKRMYDYAYNMLTHDFTRMWSVPQVSKRTGMPKLISGGVLKPWFWGKSKSLITVVPYRGFPTYETN